VSQPVGLALPIPVESADIPQNAMEHDGIRWYFGECRLLRSSLRLILLRFCAFPASSK
jgi:hypothetical protein